MKRQILMVLALFLLAVSPSCDCGGTQTTSGTSEGTPTGNTGGPTPDTGPAHDGKPGSPCDNPSECDSGICTFGRCGIDLNACETKNACGTCGNSNCKDDSVGGDGNPIDLQNDPDNLQDSGDVVVKKDASTGGRPAVTIDVKKNQQNYIWIANTAIGKISKVNTKNRQEEAVYDTGPLGAKNDPSRTALNSFGDAFVANRTGKSVTKIAGSLDDCVDKNKNGTIETSTGRTDIKPWGDDECVLWNTPIPGNYVRGLAAQDYDPVTGDLNPVVWVGSYSAKTLYKLDANDGRILLTAPIDTTIYGLAVDDEGNLWSSTLSANNLVKIDTKRCRDAASCTNTGVAGCTDGTEDECVIQKIPFGHYTYGITVDNKQRVWLGGAEVCSYDRKKPFGNRVECTAVGSTAGIQADDKGFIWAGDGGSGDMIRMKADEPSTYVRIAGAPSRGVAVDLEGYIWGIPNSSNPGVTVVDPGDDINDNGVNAGLVGTIKNAYTYSDMTGSQLRFVGKSRGFYARKFEGCDPAVTGGTNWLKLKWDANAPTPTEIVFSIRGAADRASLATAPWRKVAVAPTDASPFDITSFIETNNLQDAGILEVRAELITGRLNDKDHTLLAPQLFSMSVVSSCKPKPTG